METEVQRSVSLRLNRRGDRNNQFQQNKGNRKLFFSFRPLSGCWESKEKKRRCFYGYSLFQLVNSLRM